MIIKKISFWIVIFGVALFVIAATLGAVLLPHYNSFTQLISETYAMGTPYGKLLRFGGFIPSGFLIALFCFLSMFQFPKNGVIKLGLFGVGIFYGVATMVAGIFPCDQGCNTEWIDPSISQFIHNLSGLLTYLFVPISIIVVGIGFRQLDTKHSMTFFSLVSGLAAILFISFLFTDPITKYIGLYQRIIEVIFLSWIVVCAYFIKKS